jgi:uncharacterized iron-regulated membrane protein
MTSDAITLPPAQRVQRWYAYLLVWRVHQLLGIFFAALLVLLSVTGSLLVIHQEIERVLEPDRHIVSALDQTAPARPLAALAHSVAERAPTGFRLFRIEPASAADETHKFLFLGSEGKTRWSAFVVPATGEIRWSGFDQSLFTPWLLQLHMQLRAGRIGYFITGISGLGLVVLGLTGIYLYRERLGALWRHPFRLRLGWRVALSDLHKWIGIAALYFVIVLGLTGAFYVLASLKAKTPALVRTPLSVTQLPPLEPLLTLASRELPHTEILRLQFPAEANGAIVALLLHRDAPVWRKFSRIEFDARTGNVRTIRAAANNSAGDQFAAMLAPLHFGFYGATWVKWAYFFGGLSPALLGLTGLLIWRLRSSAPSRSSGIR